MTGIERLEAIWKRGKARIIVKQSLPDRDEQQGSTFELATGERQRTTDYGESKTLDGSRKLRLRQA